MTSLLLKNCDVLSFDGGKTHVEFNHDIAIKGDTITTITKSGALPEAEFEQSMDASGLLGSTGFHQYPRACSHGTVPQPS